ncbi:MAG: hypothetical protein VX529_08080 [Pseudomonadota bacterium]|nr:hypothetical protein [Pseudomonadota bacterium]
MKLDEVKFSQHDGKRTEFPSEIREAIARIGRTDDGKQLTRFLLNAYVMNVPEVGLPDGALREYVATKRLARRILQLLQGDLNDDGNDIDAGKRRGPVWFERIIRIGNLDR